MNRRNFIKTFGAILSGGALVLLKGCGNMMGIDTDRLICDRGRSYDREFFKFPVLEHSDNGKGGSYAIGKLNIVEQCHVFDPSGVGVASKTIALQTAALNTQSYGGPIIRITRGDTVEFDIQNQITFPTLNGGTQTTQHWHGLHVVGQVDGTPHQPIASGNNWKVKIKVEKEASTNWYHAHIHHDTQELVNRGHAGFIVVDDVNSRALPIPKTINVDDIPILTKYQSFGNSGGLVATRTNLAMGMHGLVGKMLANGKVNSLLKVGKKWVRVRILNASDGEAALSLTYKLSDNRSFYMIATDGGFLDTPVSLTTCSLSSGERAEFLIDFTGDEIGKQLTFQAAPTIGNGAGSLRGYETLLTFEVESQDGGITTLDTQMALRGKGITKIDWSTVKNNAQTLFDNPAARISVGVGHMMGYSGNTVIIDTSLGNRARSGTRDDVMAAMPTSYTNAIEGVYRNNTGMAMDKNTVALSVKKNVWQVWNFTTANHPLHVHGCSFLPLTIGGRAPGDHQKGWKDVIFPTAGGNSKFLVRFDHHTYGPNMVDASANTEAQDPGYTLPSGSSPGASTGVIGKGGEIADYAPYMIHCHFLHHEDGGMMAQFNVVDAADEG